MNIAYVIQSAKGADQQLMGPPKSARFDQSKQEVGKAVSILIIC
jgi:hypothetical protein